MSDSSNEPETILRPSNESVIAKLFVFAIGLAVIPLGLLYAIMNGAADGVSLASAVSSADGFWLDSYCCCVQAS